MRKKQRLRINQKAYFNAHPERERARKRQEYAQDTLQQTET